jgi:hypothetical protein
MFYSPHQNEIQDHNVQAVHKSFENVTKCKYLGLTLTLQTQNCVHKETESRLTL